MNNYCPWIVAGSNSDFWSSLTYLDFYSNTLVFDSPIRSRRIAAEPGAFPNCCWPEKLGPKPKQPLRSCSNSLVEYLLEIELACGRIDFRGSLICEDQDANQHFNYWRFPCGS